MNKLKELRKSRKKTQKEISEDLNIPYRTLQRWENGESNIKPDKAQQLADYFGVSAGYLLGYSDFTNSVEISSQLKSQEIPNINNFVRDKIFNSDDSVTLTQVLNYDFDKNIDNLMSIIDILIEKHNEIFSMYYAHSLKKHLNSKQLKRLKEYLKFYSDFTIENNDYNTVFQDMLGSIARSHSTQLKKDN